jgi:small-conductance mechanosensitive channel
MKNNRNLFAGLCAVLFSVMHISHIAPSMLGFPFTMMGSGSDISFAFLKSADAARQKEYLSRQEQLVKLQAYIQEYAIKSASIHTQAREKIEVLKQKMLLSGEQGAVDGQIRALFADRERVALTTIEISTDIAKHLEGHEALLKKFIAILSTDMQQQASEQKTSFSWQQFKDAKKRLAEETAKLEYLKEKRGLIIREGARVHDQALLGNKQLEQDILELEARRDAAAGSNEREYFLTLIGLQRALLEEVIVAQKYEQESQAQKEASQHTEYALQKYIVHQLEHKLPELQERMVFEPTDIALAEQELRAQKKETADVVGLLARDFRRVRSEKEVLLKRKQSIETLKVKNETYTAEQDKIEQEIKLLHERELFLAHKHHFVEAKVEQKKLQHFIVTLMYERANDYTGTVVPQKINGWFLEINQIKKQVDSQLEQLYDYIQDGTLKADEHRKYSETVVTKLQGKLSQQAQYVYESLLDVMSQLRQVDQEILSINSQHVELYKAMKTDIEFVSDELVREQRAINIWQRSRRAVSYIQLKQAWVDVCSFALVMYQRTLYLLSPLTLIREGFGFEFFSYFLLLFFVLFFLLFIAAIQWGVAHFGRYIDRLLYIYQGKVWAIYLTIFRAFVRFIEQYGRGLAAWLCIRMHIAFDCKYYLFAGLKPLYGPYFVALFYVTSIPYFVYLSYHLMREIKTINQRMSFLFFTEALQTKFLLLLSSVLYLSALLLPLRRVFLCTVITDTFDRAISPVPNVIYGAWTLAISIVFLLFFNKQDVLRLIPSHGRLGSFISTGITRYYYPVFFFIMGFLILINPYVGYSNLAMYLAACVPLTVMVIYILLALHSWVRRYSMALFIKEEEGSDDEGTDRFEHAKMYYGVFILVTFLIAVICAFLAITNIWGIQYTLAQLWKGLTYDWVLTIEGTGVNIGFGGLLTISLFMVSGFVISSVFSKFVLSKLFDIFRVEAGAQNTTSRILHYAIIFFSVILGLHAIKLGQLGNWLLFGLALGIFLGAKDLVADFFSGLWILIERPIEPGNYIETGNLRGTVKNIALRATTIRTAQNYSVIVPNRELVSKSIINWGGGYYAVGFEFMVTVSYHADAQKVRDLIAQVVSSNPQVLRIPAVMVRLEEFGDHGLEYKVRAFISSRRVREQWDIAAAIRIELLKMFQENNIGIPYPHLVIQRENAFGFSKRAYEEIVEEEQSK